MNINGIPVEVMGAFGEYYSAFITEIKSATCVTINLARDNTNITNLKAQVHPSILRIPPNVRSHDNINHSEIVVGQEVEVLFSPESTSDTATQIPPSWWCGVVQKSKGCFVVVNINADINKIVSKTSELSGMIQTVTENGPLAIPLPHGISHTEVVETSQIRARNWHSNLTGDSIYKHILYLPMKYRCQDPLNFEPLLEHCGPPSLVCIASPELYSPKDAKFGLLIASTQYPVVQKAAFIENSFISSLESRMHLIKENQDLTKKLEEIRTNKALFAFTAEFSIPPHLGNRITDRNLQKAQSIEGVTSVHYNKEYHSFRITGSNAEAVKRAQEILEFAVDSLLVPAVYVSRLNNLQDLVDRVGLGSLSVESAGPNRAAFAEFKFVGTRSAINDGKMALSYHIAGLRELDRIRGVEEPPNPPVESKQSLREPNKNIHRGANGRKSQKSPKNNEISDNAHVNNKNYRQVNRQAKKKSSFSDHSEGTPVHMDDYINVQSETVLNGHEMTNGSTKTPQSNGERQNNGVGRGTRYQKPRPKTKPSISEGDVSNNRVTLNEKMTNRQCLVVANGKD